MVQCRSCPARMSHVTSLLLMAQNGNFRDFGSFSVGRKRRTCPSAGWAPASNAIGTDTDIYIYGICDSTSDLIDLDTAIG